eukprot:TRINITY_DN46979_c0_g1_i2.p1 TRINITY_DN46979_c0_g1~~TRINITY_DN46979_c0_g1_i2.p1  ORF type:complete len:329 (-),score=27.92 TRINITY_DN46979_c0_g1_i2:435-1421(-)
MGIIIMGLYVSALVETQLALGFACDYWRCTRVLEVLDKTLIWVWPVGILLSTIDIVHHQRYQNGECELQRAIVREEETGILLLCFIVSLGAYGASVYRIHRFPGSVQSLIWRMAWVYPANFFVTYGSLLIYYLVPTSRGNTTFFAVALCLEGLNGFINALSYAGNCRYVRKSVDLRQLWIANASPQEGSWQAADNTGSGLSTSSVAEGRRAFVEFHVGFREQLESLVPVSFHSGQSPTQSSDATQGASIEQLREKARELMKKLETQDPVILQLSRRLAERRLRTGRPLPGMPILDPQSATASEVEQLEDLRAQRDSWIEYHETQLDVA